MTTPGRWRITLTVNKVAAGSTYFENDAEATNAHAFLNYAVGGSYVLSNLLSEYHAVDVGIYYPPPEFNCVISPNTTQRWTRPVPTLPVLTNTGYTAATLPAGYDWPAHLDPLMANNGPFYPSGFETNHDYYAPPYIDVRHVPR